MKIGKIEIEMGFLATFLINGEDHNLFGITPENFYYKENKKIFTTICELIEDGVSSIDIVSVSTKLLDKGELEEIGGNPYLVDISNKNIISSNRQYFATLLKEETKRIELLKISEQIRLIGDSGVKLNGNIFDMAKKLINLDTLTDGRYNLSRDIEETMNFLEDRRGKELFGASFGNEFLDKFTKGIQNGRTYRIGAVSNLGKSWLAYNIINSLLKQNKKVLFLTLENDKSFTISNLLANHMGVNPHRIENLEVEPDFGYLEDKRDIFHIIDDAYELGEIFSRILQIKPDYVILDYIGLISIKGIHEEEKYVEYAKQVQQFVKRERVGWIDLSNLEKSADEESIKTFGGFYGSSFLRNNADVGIHMFYHKPFYKYKEMVMSLSTITPEQKDKLKNLQVIEMNITKNRIGTARVGELYKIDFNNGGIFTLATEDERAGWAF